MSESLQQGKQDLIGFQSLCNTLGIPLAPEKTEGPTTRLTFAGIEIDTVEMSALLPADKLTNAKQIINNALRKTKLTLRELQSIVGFLNFACKVVVPGRAFLRRLINLTIGIKSPNHLVRLTLQARAEPAGLAVVFAANSTESHCFSQISGCQITLYICSQMQQVP